MSVLPWLDDLIRLPPDAGHYANWVFNGDSLDWCSCQLKEKLYCLLLPTVCTLRGKVARATDGKVCAWGMGNHQIPNAETFSMKMPSINNHQNIALDVKWRSVIGWKNVARPCFMP